MNTLVILSSPDDNNCTTKWELPPRWEPLFKKWLRVYARGSVCHLFEQLVVTTGVFALLFSLSCSCSVCWDVSLEMLVLIVGGNVYGHMLRTNCYQAVALPSKHKTKITNNIFILIMLNIFTLCYSILLCRECSFDLQYDSAQDDLLHIFFSL